MNWNILFLFCLTIFFRAQAATALSLEQYIQQVRSGNKNYISSQNLSEGAELRSNEGYLLTRPSLIGGADQIRDLRETGSAIQGDEIETKNYYLGLRERTPFGLDLSLIYTQNYTILPQANPAFITPNEVFAVGPTIELSQALGRNFLGREIRASQSMLNAQARAEQYAESFQQQQILAQAESAYWRLVVARETVNATKETLERSERLKKWSARRSRQQLGQRSDYLQAEAAYLARSLELQSAQAEERSAASFFNTMRGVDSDLVSETLANFESKLVDEMKVPDKFRFRDNIRAAENQMLATQANYRLNLERNKPQLNLVGSYGLSGRDPLLDEARSEASGSERPYSRIGIELDIPLDFFTQSRVRRGYRQQVEALANRFERQQFDERRLWLDLNQQFKDAVERYKLALKMEEVEEDKMNNERSRHDRGLTTTFQVIQFEQDFANAQLARLRVQAEVINIHAQLKTFGGP